MRVLNSSRLNEKVMRGMTPDEVSNIYNGLDCCVTFEIYETLIEELIESPDYVQRTYTTAMQKHGSVLDMSLRGLRVNQHYLAATVEELKRDLSALEQRFDRLCVEGLGIEKINWRSPKDVKFLFYDVLKCKVVRKRNANGAYAPSADRSALEKFQQNFYAQPFSLYILAMRGAGKSIGFLNSEMDTDGRMRTGFNIAGTNTGRLASASNEFGTGTNLQNVTKKLRTPFIADSRKMLVNVDLEQADARNVGAIIWEIYHDTKGPTEAGAYLDACESGDLHTTVCNMAWPELRWGSDRTMWRAVADGKAYRDMSYRDLAKRLGHGTNYYGQPRTMAGHTQTATNVIEAFQKNYFKAFPLIPAWHEWVKAQLETKGFLVTPFGRRRHFFNRMAEPATLREAIAYSPQSMTAYEIDTGLMQLWRADPIFELLVQVHDSIMFQIPWNRHEELIPRALELLKINHPLKGGRNFTVPLEAECGWNWGVYHPDKNPSGLKVWTGEADDRKPPTPSLLPIKRAKRRSILT